MKTGFRTLKSICCMFPLLLAVTMMAVMVGCEEKKKTVLDIETPGTKVKLKESKKDGSLELEIDKDK